MPIGNSFHDILNNRIYVKRFQRLDAVTLKIRVKIGFSNQDLAANFGGRERIDWRVNPGSQRSLRNISVLAEFP